MNFLNKNIMFQSTTENGSSGSCCQKSALIGKPAPDFSLPCLLPDGKHGIVNLKEFTSIGKWVVLYFYPADFTFVCPTEIKALSNRESEFKKYNSQVIGCSVDSVYVHEAWVKSSLKSVNHPLASDQTHKVSRAYGVYDEAEGLSWRGSFIISPDNTLWAGYTTYKTAGRSANEVLRLLQACQHSYEGKFVPCDWEQGEEFIKS